MRITSIVECGARILVRLASLPPGASLNAEKLSDLENIPRDYSDQILQRLRKAELIASTRGAHGGYHLAKMPEQITIGMMIRAVEGRIFEDVCERYSEGESACSHRDDDCGIKPVWRRLAGLVESYLDGVTLAQVMQKETKSGTVSLSPAMAALLKPSPAAKGGRTL